MAVPRVSAWLDDLRSRKKARRCAVLGPTVGSRANSSISRVTARGKRVRHSLAEARNLQAAGQSAKLALGQLLRLLDRIVHRHHDHVGQQLGILGVNG